MSRLTHALAFLYGAAALFLAHCAISSYEHGSTRYAALFGACSGFYACAVAHHCYSHDQTRQAHADLDRASGLIAIPDPAPMDPPIVRLGEQLGVDCCELWWSTAGAKHDPTTCTREGHHT